MTKIHTVDLRFYATEQIIASFLAPVEDGFVLFDPGPASCFGNLERGIEELGFRLDQLAGVFPTHVHLDHAGGAGVLSSRTGCPVYCHPKGAAHLADPHAKLLPSAERIYGEMMTPLWGTTVAVEPENVVEVADGEVVSIRGLDVVAWHTPGHAVHHVAWQIGGTVVTGDVAGVRFPGASHVLPPMPPPDIQVDDWRRSIDQLRALEPKQLMLTHYGSFDDPVRHLDELEDRLLRWTEIGDRVLADGGDRDALGSELESLDAVEMEASAVPTEAIERYRRLCPVKESSAGLFRYCSKKLQAG